MTTATAAPASAQQTAFRLPRNLRRAFLLGIRAQRTRRHVYPEGIYTARNQAWGPELVFGTVQQERAEAQLTDLERQYFRAGLSAVSQSYGKHDGERVLRIRRYARMLRDYLADGDEVQLRRLRLWIRTNLTRRAARPAPLTQRQQAEQAAVRA